MPEELRYVNRFRKERFFLFSNLTDLTDASFNLSHTFTLGSTVENALKCLKGCIHAEASFRDSYATVTCTGYSVPRLEAEAIDAIDCVGFDATVLTERPAQMATIHIKVTGMMCQKSCGTLILYFDLNVVFIEFYLHYH